MSTKSAILENSELVPLAYKLYTDFSIKVLEGRLETASPSYYHQDSLMKPCFFL